MVLVQEETVFQQRMRRFLDDGICVLALAIIPLVLLWPSIVRGDLPIGTQSVLTFAPWEEAHPAGLAPEVKPESNLMAQRYFPWYVYMSHAGTSRDILWNPMEGCGLPFLALWRTRCFSPFSIPFYLFEIGHALQLSVFLKLLVAGLCAYYAARRLGCAHPLSLFAAVIFQMSGPMTLWCAYPISDVIPWIPLMVLFCERLSLGQPRLWAQGSLIIALLLVGGDPETVAGIILFSLLYLILRFIFDLRQPREWFSPFGTFVFAVIVAHLLAAAQILPYLEFLREAAEDGHVTATYFPHIKDLLVALLPLGSGDAAAAGLADQNAMRATAILHFGLVPLLLIPLWFAVRKFASVRQRHRVEALLVVQTTMLVFALLAHLLQPRLPFFLQLNPEHYLAANAFALGLIGAATMEEWLHLNAQDCVATIKRFLFFAPVSAVLVVAVVLLTRGEPISPMGVYHWKIILDVAIGVVLFGILGATALKPSMRLLGYSACGLSALNLFLAFGTMMAFTNRDLVFPQTPFINLFKQTEGRVGGSESLSRWPLAANSILQVYGAAGVTLTRQSVFQSRIDGDPLLLRRAGTSSLLLGTEDIQGKFAAVRPLLRFVKIFQSGAVLFQDLEAKPYAWMAYVGRSVEKYDTAQLSSDQPPMMEKVMPPQPIQNPPSPNVEVKRNSATRATIQIPSTPPGVLIQADAWYPGWKATVNGAAAQLFPVDILFRGIEVPQGPVDVSISYDPLSVKVGEGVSIASLLIVLFSFQAALRRTWRESRQKKRWPR